MARVAIDELQIRLHRRIDDGAAFLAMCSECRKVRVAEGRWAPAEPLLDEQFGVAVSHGFCNECFQRFDDV